MTRVIAAVDNSLAARPVLATAQSLADLLGSTVDPIHVQTNGTRVASNETAAAGLELRVPRAPRSCGFGEVAGAGDVAAVVVGACGTPASSRPVGSTAFELIESIDKPVVVVPPDVARAGALSRVIVPLEGTLSSLARATSPHRDRLRCEPRRRGLHVHDEASLPAFTDQPQHETDAWAEEFLARYVPSRFGDVRLEVRVGRRNEEVLRAAEELDADLIALGWSQDLAPGRAPVVRGARAWTHSGDARPRLSCGDAVLRARKGVPHGQGSDHRASQGGR